MRTALIIGLLTLVGCVAGRCHEAPKAKFSVGERVAFTRCIVVDTSAYNFIVEVGDTGVISGIENLVGDDNVVIRYAVVLDKGKASNWKAHAFQSKTGDTVWDGWIEAMVYPDPALAPTKD